MTWVIDPEGAETRALEELGGLGGLRILEVGCGDGRLTHRYAAVLRPPPAYGMTKPTRS